MTSKSTQQATPHDTMHPDFTLQQSQKIILKTKSINHILYLGEMTHLICDCYLTTVYTTSGHTIVVAKLLKDFEEELINFGFIRVNRNVIINIFHVTSYGNGHKRMVALTNKTTVHISRRGLARLKGVIECIQ